MVNTTISKAAVMNKEEKTIIDHKSYAGIFTWLSIILNMFNGIFKTRHKTYILCDFIVWIRTLTPDIVQIDMRHSTTYDCMVMHVYVYITIIKVTPPLPMLHNESVCVDFLANIHTIHN